jgi:transposase-like protein
VVAPPAPPCPECHSRTEVEPYKVEKDGAVIVSWRCLSCGHHWKMIESPVSSPHSSQ